MAVPEKKMSLLQAVTKGRVERPYRITLYAPEGLGKSTFASNAPSPIFIPTEDGTAHLDVARLPRPATWADLMAGVAALTSEPHDYQTLVIDTLDAAETLNWTKVIADAPPDKSGEKPKSIEEVGGGYGKGYQAALDVWRQLLAALERLQAERKMHLVLLAHSQLKLYRNPQGDDFDRYTMKFNEKAASLFREWSDDVLFGNFETFGVKEKGTAKRVRGVSSGARLLYTIRTAAYDAKTRRGVRDGIPLDWNEFAAAATAQQPADPVALIAEIERLAKEVGGDMEKHARDAIARAGKDATKLVQLNNWLAAKAAEKEAK